MESFSYVVRNEAGIHVQQAGEIATLAKALSGASTISKGDTTVDAAKLMAIMSLGIKKGDEIVVESDCMEDLVKIREYFEAKL